MKLKIFKPKQNSSLQNFANGFHQILAYSREVFSSSESLKKFANDEKTAIQRSSVALSEISSMLEKTADNAHALKEKSQAAQDLVLEGQSSLQEVQTGFVRIQSSSGRLGEAVHARLKELDDIVTSLSEIRTKTTAIDNIVFQTKLLSFNASVEAARAGEHGKGFAVVASEMTNLAVSSGNASKEINVILEKNISNTMAILNSMKQELISLVETSIRDVEKGVDAGKVCAEVFEHVITEVKQVNHLGTDISAASKEQSIGVRDITEAIHDLQETSDNLTQLAEDTLQASLDLSRLTESQGRQLQVVATEFGSSISSPREVFDFRAAEAAHVDWKMKLVRYIEHSDNSLDPETVCRDDQCALGKWIHSDGKAHAHLATFGQLKSTHAQFHKVAAEVIRAANQNHLSRSKTLLNPGGEYSRTSERCIELIREIRHQLSGQG